MPLIGVDAVNVNEKSTAALNDPNIKFLIAKATEGRAYDAPDYVTLKTRAKAAGKLFGAYHYAWPAQDVLVEAEHFVRVAALEPGDIAVLDIEKQDDGVTWGARLRYALTWLKYVKEKTGADPFVYINRAWRTELLRVATPTQKAELTSYPLWLAQPGEPGVYEAGSDWEVDMHQYILSTGVDENWFRWDEDSWAELAVPQLDEHADIEATLASIVESIAKLDSAVATLSQSVKTLTSDFAEHRLKSDAQTRDFVVFSQKTINDLAGLATAVALAKSDVLTEVGSIAVKLAAENKVSVAEALAGFSLSVTYPNKA